MTIDWLQESQQNSFVLLLCELYHFYNAPDEVDPVMVKRHLRDNLLAEGAPMRMLVAADEDGEVIGFAALGLFHSLTDPTTRAQPSVPDERTLCAR